MGLGLVLAMGSLAGLPPYQELQLLGPVFQHLELPDPVYQRQQEWLVQAYQLLEWPAGPEFQQASLAQLAEPQELIGIQLDMDCCSVVAAQERNNNCIRTRT